MTANCLSLFYFTDSQQDQIQRETYPESTLKKNPLLTNAAQEGRSDGIYTQGNKKGRC